MSDKFLTAADIFAVDDSERKEIEVPEWGGIITFRALTAREAIDLTESMQGRFKKSGFVRIVCLCAIDPKTGERLFTDNDMEKLKSKSSKVLMRLQDPLLELNGFTKNPEEDAKNE